MLPDRVVWTACSVDVRLVEKRAGTSPPSIDQCLICVDIETAGASVVASAFPSYQHLH